MPTWKGLVERIMMHHQVFGPAIGASKYTELAETGYRLETIARMAEIKVIKDHGGDRAAAAAAFASIIRECLYSGTEFAAWWREKRQSAIDISSTNAQLFSEFIATTNKTLRAVYDLCVLRGGPNTSNLCINNNVHAVVNFNFDSLLSSYDKAMHYLVRHKDKRCLRTIERPTAGPIPGRISVYHPHGFFRFDRGRDDPEKEAPDLRIFTETEYYDFFNKPMEMYTYTMLHLFREYRCLFVGSSMTDENVRRLLHYCKDEERKSYDRERVRFQEVARAAGDEKLRHFAILPERDFDVDTLVEASLADLGVNVCWIKDFDEIPVLLDGLRQDGA